jgi:hypothetical protein
VDIQPHIAFGGALRFAGMQPDAHSHCCVLGPGVSGKSALDVHRGADRIAGAGKDYEKGIALRVHLLPVPLPEGRSQQAPALLQESSVAFAQLLQQVRGPFYIGEEQGDGSSRQLRHSWPPRVMTAEDASHLRNGHAPIVHRYEYLTQLFTALTHLFARNRLFKGFF